MKIGDKIKVVLENSRYANREGVIVQDDGVSSNHFLVNLTGNFVWLYSNEIVVLFNVKKERIIWQKPNLHKRTVNTQ